jgi:Protein kinase domain
MAVADDSVGGLTVDSATPSRSRSSSPNRSSSPEYASTTSCPIPPETSTPPINGVNEPFQIPRYNFPPNLIPQNVRRQPSVKSPTARSPNEYSSLPPTPAVPRQTDSSTSNGSYHHVTETHHITKDYDQRTGAKTINRYEFQETIGRGVHGKVKLAKDIETGEFVAIKIVNRVTRKRLGRWDPMEAEHKIRREIAIMKKCVHPHVVALREVMDDPDSKKIYLGISF